MPQLKDMKLTAADQQEWRQEVMSEPSAPEYSYGMKLRLGKEELDKLGISLPALGEKMEIAAVAEVTETRQESSEEFGEEKTVELQVQQLGLAPAQPDPGERLYPGGTGMGGSTGS